MRSSLIYVLPLLQCLFTAVNEHCRRAVKCIGMLHCDTGTALSQSPHNSVLHPRWTQCYIVTQGQPWASRHTTQCYIPDEPNVTLWHRDSLEPVATQLSVTSQINPIFSSTAARNSNIWIRHGVQLAQGKGRTHYGRPVRKVWFQSLGVVRVQRRPTWPVGSELSAFYLAPFPRSTWRRRCIQPPNMIFL